MQAPDNLPMASATYHGADPQGASEGDQAEEDVDGRQAKALHGPHEVLAQSHVGHPVGHQCKGNGTTWGRKGKRRGKYEGL